MARKLALGARFFFAQPVPPPVAVQVGALVQPVLLRLVRASDFLAAATKDQVKFAHFLALSLSLSKLLLKLLMALLMALSVLALLMAFEVVGLDVSS